MGFISSAVNILDKTARVLNEAAFGDIRNIFNDNLYGLRMRNIGLADKDYWFMVRHLYRNIGNSEYVYDGYSTPIGELANPYYNTHMFVPWFYIDAYKNSTANYIDYVKATYGATLSVENINDNDLFHLSEEAVKVGSVDGRFAIEALASGNDLLPNNNGTGTDTHLGIISGYYNRETLSNALVANNRRNQSISKGFTHYLGLKTNNIEDQKTYIKEIDTETGRFADGVFNPLINVAGPIDENIGYDRTSSWGEYVDKDFDTYGFYNGFFDSLSKNTKEIYQNNIYSNRYRVDLDGNFSFTYFTNNGIDASIDEQNIRYIFKQSKDTSSHTNVLDSTNGSVYVYTENESGSATTIYGASYNFGTRFSKYTSYGEGLTADDLLKKTNDSFKNGSYKTIVARFRTDSDEADITDTTQTAISKEWGLSHGRNLLKLVPDDSEGYTNPYCRVWTFHHQYHRLKDAIRPLDISAEKLYSEHNFSAFTADHSLKGFENGRTRLEKYGSLNKNNGLVNITPIDNNNSSKKVDIRNCMFSIENLAWKDAFSTDAASRSSFQAGGLSSEQKGPFGGRIMWFPPYDLKFSENVNVNWNETNFIGRGEGIYTYTNTTRSGNLSFKILVDHPSIINYWENKGKSKTDSVDTKDDPEQELLRFFAGCSMLTAKNVPIPEPKPVINDTPIPAPVTEVLRFFVFYPNNYSGIDDTPTFATSYLTNGLGAGKTKDSKGSTVDYSIPYAKTSNGYGGYEMRPGKPISLVKTQDENNIRIIKTGVTVGGSSVDLYVQEGDSTNTLWERKWYYRIDNRYKNQELKKESYLDTTNYGLNSKTGLEKVAKQFKVTDTDNLYSFADVYAALEGSERKKVLEGLYDDKKVSNFLAKLKQYDVDFIECIGMASVQGHQNLNVDLQKHRAETVKKWLATKSQFKSSTIKVTTGGTGGHGYGINKGDENDVSNKLWRCAEVRIHIKKEASKTVQAAVSENFTKVNNNNESGRRASEADATIYHQNNIVISNINNTGGERIKNFNDLSSNKIIEERVVNERLTSIRLNKLSDNINGLALNLKESVRGGNVNINSIFGAVAEFSEHNKHFQYDKYGYIVNDSRGKSNYDYAYNEMWDEAAKDEVAGWNNTLKDKTEKDLSDGEKTKYAKERIGTKNNQPVRYDNEAKFFSMLEKEEPFLHHKISDKIKYFDPAFHSISPEGFNARLTFLQQCTRQGPTIGNSDNYTANNTATNLAFGRPPVCILRIGDFYYTKILIESMTINFDPLMWDLNTEGIGVMPMIANVDLNFKFIGGSSLAGHITRLQNALSFNYYANTEVYDNRSELAEYDENGNITRLGTENLIM